MAARPAESTEIAVIGAGVMGDERRLPPRAAWRARAAARQAGRGRRARRAPRPACCARTTRIPRSSRWRATAASSWPRCSSARAPTRASSTAATWPSARPTASRASARRSTRMRSQGVVVEQLDNAQIRALEPRLAAGALVIGAYEPENGVCEPLFVADGFARAAERLGARLSFGARVTAVRPDGGGFRVFCADGRRIAAERVAVCCGGFGPRLTRPLGGSLPVDLVRVQAGRFRPPFPFGGRVRSSPHHTLGVWLRPDGDDGHYLVGARADFLGRGPYRARSGQGGADQRELERLAGLVATSSRARRGVSSAAPGRAGSTSRPTATPSSTCSPAAPACCSQAACRATPSSSAGARPGRRRAPAGRRGPLVRLEPFRYGRFDAPRRRRPAAQAARGPAETPHW